MNPLIFLDSFQNIKLLMFSLINIRFYIR